MIMKVRGWEGEAGELAVGRATAHYNGMESGQSRVGRG